MICEQHTILYPFICCGWVLTGLVQLVIISVVLTIISNGGTHDPQHHAQHNGRPLPELPR